MPSFALVCAVLGGSGRAWALDELTGAAEAPDGRRARSDLLVFGAPAAVGYAACGCGGLMLGSGASFRSGPALFGLDTELASGLWAFTSAAIGPHLGLSLNSGRLRLDAVGRAGWRRYTGWSAGFLDDDPGASAALPYLGGRLRLGHVGHAHRNNHLFIGMEAGLDRDLGERSRTYSYTDDSDWFDNDADPEIVTETTTVGGLRWAAGLSLGVVFDLGAARAPRGYAEGGRPREGSR